MQELGNVLEYHGESAAAAPLSEELVRYLALAVAAAEGELSPSPLVDLAWHTLLADPRLYYETCACLRPAGTPPGVATLVPHDAARAGDADAAILARYHRTLAAYKARYTPAAPEALWPRDYRAGSGECGAGAGAAGAAGSGAGAAGAGAGASGAGAAGAGAGAAGAGKGAAGTGELAVITLVDLCGIHTRVAIKLSYTVERVKGLYEIAKGVPPDDQRFVFSGKQLEDGNTMQHYGVTHGSLVHVVLRLRGC